MFSWYIYGVSRKETIITDRSTKRMSNMKDCVKELKQRLRLHAYPDGYIPKALIVIHDEDLYLQVTDHNPHANKLVECDECHRA